MAETSPFAQMLRRPWSRARLRAARRRIVRRNSAGPADRRLACRPRRHRYEHVLCVFAADAYARDIEPGARARGQGRAKKPGWRQSGSQTCGTRFPDACLPSGHFLPAEPASSLMRESNGLLQASVFSAFDARSGRRRGPRRASAIIGTTCRVSCSSRTRLPTTRSSNTTGRSRSCPTRGSRSRS